MRKITVTEHINGPMREYALYTIYRRAIPSLIDGLKPGQRKALYTALQVCRNKKIKTLALTGYTFPISNFHHGDASMTEAIIKMTRRFDNNIPIFEGEGNFGTRMVTAASSPRYTHVKLSNEFDKYFFDLDILPENPDPENPEPLFYLPIIPWVLVNGSKGVATGFATDILPRNPKDVAARCRQYLSTGKISNKNLFPSFPEFKGTVEEDGDSWIVSGKIIRKSPTKVEVVEIPIGYDRAKYVSQLDRLESSGTILNYVDKCSKKGFLFEITLPRKLKKIDNDTLLTKLKLKKRFSENLTVIDEKGKLCKFDGVGELIAKFCDYRLSMYEKRYDAWIKRDKEKRHNLSEKARFIRLVLEGKIKFNGEKKKDIQAQMKNHKFSEAHCNSLLEIPIYNLTGDTVKKLEKEILRLDKDIKIWQTVDKKKQFIKELDSL